MNLLVGYAWLISAMKLSDLLFHDSREQLHLQCITTILHASCNSSFQVHSIKSSDVLVVVAGMCVTSIQAIRGVRLRTKFPTIEVSRKRILRFAENGYSETGFIVLVVFSGVC